MLKYEITFSPLETHLHVHVTGSQLSRNIAFDFWVQIIKESANQRQKLILIEESFPNQIGIFDHYQNINELSGHMKGLTILYVDTNPSHFGKHQFVETLAVNLGIEYFVFDNLQQAEERLSAIVSVA
jgi:hypothetical protein